MKSFFTTRFRTCGAVCALLLLSPGLAGATAPGGDGWFDLPLRPASDDVKGQYVYFVGGYNSEDNGTYPWGSLVESVNLYIGDKAGDIEIEYRDGKTDVVPLVFGYTMWFRGNWLDGGAPFKTDAAEPEMTACLNEALHLQGAFDGAEQPVFKVRIQNKPIRGIRVVDNPHKRGEPVLKGGYLLPTDKKGTLAGGPAVNTDDAFFDTHTIDSRRPDTKRAQIDRMIRRLYTFEEDFAAAQPFAYPEGYSRAKVTFGGSPYAHILTRVFHDNLEDLVKNKMRPDGMIDESSKGAPSWRYDGFGTWVPAANSYVGSMYSRNRSLGILSYLDLLAESQRSVDFLNRWLMYYPDHNLTMLGKRIPGHWSVIPNKPLEYSTFLTVVAGWPTRYTKELFGDDYQNFGNSEPDGHGMTMMSIANVWLNSGAPAQWVLDNWKYVSEAVHYIDWAMKNPDVSFNENGLMYGETEGGMMEFTMFNNVPCYLGVRMYAGMALKAGKQQEASEWNALADRMERAILEGFSREGKWDMTKFGFFHDPSMAMFADYVGYDVRRDAPGAWFALCDSTYRDDVNRYVGDSFIGPRGLGYDHNIISQTSLLLDRTADYGRFVANLAKLCYSPRLPQPFIVPECASYSRDRGMYRRQGDLGNYVQQTETLRTLLLVAGTSHLRDGEVKLMPRLPEGWSVDVQELTVPGSGAKISYRTAYPEKGRQELTLSVSHPGDLRAVEFRAGPFTAQQVTVDGRAVATEPEGDARWAWIRIDDLKDGQSRTLRIE